MVAKTYNLEFKGYWPKPQIGGLPADSGIYGVYACTYRPDSGVTLNRLIYIGESDDVRERVKSHERWPDWESKLRTGEEVCFNVALISPATDRERAEAAMIYKHKPTCNSEHVNEFTSDTTTINTSGRNAHMEEHFTVYRTT